MTKFDWAHFIIFPKNVPTSFWQYSGSLGRFLSTHGDGGEGDGAGGGLGESGGEGSGSKGDGSEGGGRGGDGGDGGGGLGGGGSESGGSEGGGDIQLPVSSDSARPGDGDCGEGGMPTTAISTGSHCGGHAPPWVERRGFEAGMPNPCTMIACAG